MRKYFLIFLFAFLLTTPLAHADVLSTTGFIPGQIWYSKDTLIEGDTVKIYTAIWNNGTTPLSAKVEFYDKNVILGTRDVVVPSLQLVETSVSWKVTSGEHSISAKIISPSTTKSGKKEPLTLTTNTTDVYSQFVPVVLKTMDGKPATNSDVLKNQLDKASMSIDSLLPDVVSEPISNNLGFVEQFRDDTLSKITETKTAAKSKLDELKKVNDPKVNTKVTNSNQSVKKTSLDDATEKPITYLKLIFFSILSLIFGSKFIFYLLIAFIVFLIIRGIYRKIKYR